jgi:uncharacterized DUF497 family protein
MAQTGFEWDPDKDVENRNKHGASFDLAQFAFADPRRVIAEDLTHSTETERRFYSFGVVGGGVMTVRFTYRTGPIRIFNAGYWRRGKRLYEQTNQIHERAARPPKSR